MIRPDDDRAQLMLLGAVVIAVALLALVTVLNSTIYAQNVAPGNALDDTAEMAEQRRVVQTDLARVSERLQEMDGYLDGERLNDTVERYAAYRAEQTIQRSPAHVDVAVNRTTPSSHTVLRQDRDRHFKAATNVNDWTLVENATLTGTSPFEVEVEMQDSGQPTSFRVDGDSGGTWLLTFEPDGDLEVTYDDGTTDVVSPAGKSVAVNVTAGTVDGTDEFDFAPGLDAPYDVSVEGGQHVANGSYTVTVDDGSDVRDGNFHDSRVDGNPYTATPVSKAVVDVRYVTDAVSMDAQVEVTA